MKISRDEFISKRKGAVREDGGRLIMSRGFREPASWNDAKRSARFVMSTQAPDRYKDVVVIEGMAVENFAKNPVALAFHNSWNWPVGKWEGIEKILTGRPKRLEGDLVFPAEGEDADCDKAAKMVKMGMVNAVSVGFMVDWEQIDYIMEGDDWSGGFRFNSTDLLECSLVPIPANPQAIVKGTPEGAIALELIENVLDTWEKNAVGLVVPRSQIEQQRKDLAGNRSTVVVDQFGEESESQVDKSADPVGEPAAPVDKAKAADAGATLTIEEDGDSVTICAVKCKPSILERILGVFKQKSPAADADAEPSSPKIQISDEEKARILAEAKEIQRSVDI